MTKVRAKALLEGAMGLLTVPSGNPALTLSQFEAFSKQVPLMYFILLVNMIALASTHVEVAPSWLVIYLPGVIGAVCLWRMIGWLRYRNVKLDATEAYRKLRATNLVAAPIAVACVSWAIMMLPYGDAFQKSHVAFFMAITVIGCIFCLMHLRSAAFIVTLIVNVPFIVSMVLIGEPTFIAIAVNLLLVTIAMISILMAQYRDFRRLTESRQALIGQQSELNAQNLAIKALSDANMQLANLDSLTNLQNRRSFFRTLVEQFERAQSQGSALAIGVIDLDGFKPVNDMYGHSAGDRVLIEVGSRLGLLESEAISIFRMGGDEFGLILCRPSGESEVLKLGRMICDVICEPINVGTGTVQVTGSIGFAIFPDVGANGQELYERADYALYTAKRRHRADAVVFNAQQAEELNRQKIVEEAMTSADFASELSLVYQPIIDITSGRCVGFEALARWRNPSIGHVSPGEFIPIAEHTGRITMITRTLLERALEVAKDWPVGTILSFNLSAHDLASAAGIVRLMGIVEASGIDPCCINFEITETAVMHDFEQARASIELLRRIGAGIALDDFGTGYSSLHHIHKLPLTKIKIDGSFVRDIQNREASFKIVKSLLALCADMALDAIVEGVETQAELSVLEGLGATLVQGYFFSRPILSEDIGPYMSRSDQGAVRRVTG